MRSMGTQTLLNEEIEYLDPLLCLRLEEELYYPCGNTRFGKWHYHREIEIIAVREGRLGIETAEATYELSAGDVCVLGASEVHRSRKTGVDNLRYWVLQFDPAPYFDSSSVVYLGAFTDEGVPLSRLSSIFADNKECASEAYGLIERLNEIVVRRDKGYGLAISSIVKHLLWILIREDRSGTIPGEEDHPGRLRLRPALLHIENHLSERIAVEDLSSLLNFSYHHFVKLFQKTIGLSLTEYLHYRRIKEAEKLLLTEDWNLAQIGEAVGIPSSAQFHKLFRRIHGCSPKQYKDRRRGPETI
ncbi:AraC family transcriptional regulator [Cohnella fermenti]|uniref:AraC family transcriptional regulator n=1 Tax=Cohnella fermenti TaxID=2565925 RepID=A0A4S4BUY4_9BACL|nr:AraC family transcriptional regulator [Cohnella fermenti]THF78405.1 AraC family transcriptional regulator [Cohnella fermenti]